MQQNNKTFREVLSEEKNNMKLTRSKNIVPHYYANDLSRLFMVRGYALERHGRRYAKFPINCLELMAAVYLESVGIFTSATYLKWYFKSRL